MKILLTVTAIIWIWFFIVSLNVLGNDKYSHIGIIIKFLLSMAVPSILAIATFIFGYVFVWIWSV